MIALCGCDGGWQKQIDDRDDSIIRLTTANNQLKKSYDSLIADSRNWERVQIDIINGMIVAHNKCVHGSPIN